MPGSGSDLERARALAGDRWTRHAPGLATHLDSPRTMADMTDVAGGPTPSASSARGRVPAATGSTTSSMQTSQAVRPMWMAPSTLLTARSSECRDRRLEPCPPAHGQSVHFVLAQLYTRGMDVAVSDLRAHLSEWLARAREGEEVLVTERGVPIARLLGVTTTATLERLTAEGVIARPERAQRTPASGRRRPRPGHPVSVVVSQQRR